MDEYVLSALPELEVIGKYVVDKIDIKAMTSLKAFGFSMEQTNVPYQS